MKKNAPPATPKSIKLRAEAAHWYLAAREQGNDRKLKSRAAKLEKEAIDCEGCEDYLWSLNQPLGENVQGFQHEPAIREELARLDQDIGRRLLKLTPQRKKPPRLLGLLEDRELVVARFREVLSDRQEWRLQQREAWRLALNKPSRRSKKLLGPILPVARE